MDITKRLELRRSSAAGKHDDKRTKRERTRDAARRAAIRDQAFDLRYRRTT